MSGAGATYAGLNHKGGCSRFGDIAGARFVVGPGLICADSELAVSVLEISHRWASCQALLNQAGKSSIMAIILCLK